MHSARPPSFFDERQTSDGATRLAVDDSTTAPKTTQRRGLPPATHINKASTPARPTSATPAKSASAFAATFAAFSSAVPEDGTVKSRYASEADLEEDEGLNKVSFRMAPQVYQHVSLILFIASDMVEHFPAH
jgi:hypothetical protein